MVRVGYEWLWQISARILNRKSFLILSRQGRICCCLCLKTLSLRRRMHVNCWSWLGHPQGWPATKDWRAKPIQNLVGLSYLWACILPRWHPLILQVQVWRKTVLNTVPFSPFLFQTIYFSQSLKNMKVLHRSTYIFLLLWSNEIHTFGMSVFWA